MARVFFRDALACRELPEVAIASLARVDGVPLEEARRRFLEAQAQHDRRAQAEYNRRSRLKEALASLRWSILCRCAAPEAIHDGVPITESLLLDLALLYKQSSRCKRTPDAAWVRGIFEVMQQEGLISCDAAGLHLTEPGRAHYDWVMAGAKPA